MPEYPYKKEDRRIRASFDAQTIVVYQAFNHEIAARAVLKQSFRGTSFKMDRMSWIKPSFLWMMYRSGWGQKPNQERILSIRVLRSGIESALNDSCLSSFDRQFYPNHEQWKLALGSSPVRVQWDPERDLLLRKTGEQTIQIGLSGDVLKEFVSTWITEIQDITAFCIHVRELIIEGRNKEASQILPEESTLPVPLEIARRIGILSA